MRKTWRKKLRSACESGIYINPKELAKMVLSMSEAYEYLLPPVNVGFVDADEIEEAYDSIAYKISCDSGKDKSESTYEQKLNFGFYVDFNFAEDELPKPFEWKTEIKSVQNYSDATSIFGCSCSGAGKTTRMCDCV